MTIKQAAKNYNQNPLKADRPSSPSQREKRENRRLVKSLLEWFERNRRDLPWRNNPTPYSIWISEIMLQQTVVKTVIPYFEKWMEKYPTIYRLAKAKEREILKLWEGLGYYTRGRNILKAARIIVKEHDGRLPDNDKDLMRLPGIGEYTSAAILSIAYGKPYPVLDANVRRVGRRLLALEKWDRKAEKILEEWLRDLLPRDRPGAFHEALMELGQTICNSRNPLCSGCPLKRFCLGFQNNLQNEIPGRGKSAIIQREQILIIPIHGDKVLIRKNEGNLFQGLWCFPAMKKEGSIPGFIQKEIAEDFRELGKLTERNHYYTRYRVHLIPLVYQVENPHGKSKKGEKWVLLRDLKDYPFPSIYRKILDDLREFLSQKL